MNSSRTAKIYRPGTFSDTAGTIRLHLCMKPAAKKWLLAGNYGLGIVLIELQAVRAAESWVPLGFI